MERNNLDPFDRHLRHKLSGSAPTEVHERTQKHFESLAAQMKQRQIGSAESPYDWRNPVLVLASTLWRELIWPWRRIWAGLACAWLLIIGLNLASPDSSSRVVSETEPRSREENRALIEQRRMLAQLIGPLPETASARKHNPPGPRSDRSLKTSVA